MQRLTRPSGSSPDALHPPDRDARERLLRCALHLFAHQGFSKTSTRELAEAAQVNVAAISYYFGDKAGLYRAVFFEPMAASEQSLAELTQGQHALPIDRFLTGFYAAFLEPLRQGETARLCMKLHFREMLEPTGLWQEEIDRDIRPMHEALIAQLSRHLGSEPDAEMQRLAVCLTGLGVHLHVGHDVIAEVAPALNEGEGSVDRWSECLVRMGLAMIDAEATRRARATEVGR